MQTKKKYMNYSDVINDLDLLLSGLSESTNVSEMNKLSFENVFFRTG